MKTKTIYGVACGFFLFAVTAVSCLADPHPAFTAKYLREKSDLIAVCRIIEFVRVSRAVDCPLHQKAFDIVVEIEDLLKGTTNKTRISIAHLRQTVSNKTPLDFGSQINEGIEQLDFAEVLDISRDRVFLLVYLRKPLIQQDAYSPTSTNNWENYSLHVLSGRFN